MKDFQQNPAAAFGIQMSSTCFVCQKPIVENNWFCRLPQKLDGAADHGAAKVLLCSPSCAFRYFAFSETGFSQV